MSKYTTDKNGVIVGSDNWWFYQDEEGEFQSHFRSVLWCGQYDFDNINPLNYGILTPAQQLLVIKKVETVKKVYKDMEWDEDREFYVIKDWWKDWLNKNCKKRWGVAPHDKTSMGSPSIFFESVRDAWNTRKFIAGQLKDFPRIKVR